MPLATHRLLRRLLPFLAWRRQLDAATLRTDLLAGVTVALVAIPQALAYAQLAGLPAYVGLYASLLPSIVAALFGSSPQLNTGPVALTSLLTAAALAPLALPGSAPTGEAVSLTLTVDGTAVSQPAVLVNGNYYLAEGFLAQLGAESALVEGVLAITAA